MQERAYLDYNATAPLLDAARLAMLDAMSLSGNASSVHKEGRQARQTVEKARRDVADLIGATHANVIFTSSATEAATQALSPVMKAGDREIEISKLFVSAVEHPCVLSGGRFTADNVLVLPVHSNGLLDLEALDTALAAHDQTSGACMVAVQFANSETGICQPLDEISKTVRSHNAFLLVDAVQALGKTDVSIEAINADFVLLSSHKIGGPQGVGALVLRDGSLSPTPLMKGSQENHHRGGTENIAAIAGFGAACEWHGANASYRNQIKVLRDGVEKSIQGFRLNNASKIGLPTLVGNNVDRLPNTSCFVASGISAETALIALDLGGIALSSGSACSSGKVGKSHVLGAMGMKDDLARSALRVSLGWNSQKSDVDRFTASYEQILHNAA